MGDPHGPNNISKVSMVSSVRILTISSLSHLETNLWESCQDSSNDSPGAIFESRHDTMLRHPVHPYFSVVVYNSPTITTVQPSKSENDTSKSSEPVQVSAVVPVMSSSAEAC